MSPWLLALTAGLVVAFVQYGWRDLRTGLAVLPSALLRIGAVTLLVALLLDAPASRSRPVSNWAALDVSASMVRGDTMLLASGTRCRCTQQLGAESVFVFGTIRLGERMPRRIPHPATSRRSCDPSSNVRSARVIQIDRRRGAVSFDESRCRAKPCSGIHAVSW